MALPRLTSTPEWKQFLRLGEELLNHPAARDQISIIEETIQQYLNASARVWLAKPYYPLPGDPDTPAYSPDTAPEPVRRVLTTHQPLRLIDEETGAGVHTLYLPLQTRDLLLGVLQVERSPGQPFRKEEMDILEGLAAHASLNLQAARQVTIKNYRSGQLALVRKVSAQIANILDLDELSRQVTDLIRESFNYYYVAIFTVDPDSPLLQFRASSSVSENATGLHWSIPVKLGEGIVGYVAQSGEVLLSNDVINEPRYRYVDALPETRSEVAIPLKVENRVLGVLDIQSNERGAFHENDLIVMQALADNIALAVEGARLYSSLRRRADELSVVYEITHALNSILDIDELLEEVVNTIQRWFQIPYVHLYTVHAGRKKVIYVAGSGARSREFERNEVTFDLDDPQGIIPWVARSGQTRLSNNVAEDPLYRPSPFAPIDTQSEMAIPLLFGGDVLGVLDVQSDEPQAFDPDDQSLLEALAGSIAVAIRNATLYRSEQWRRQVADSFRDVAGLVSANTAIDQLLKRILVELENNLPCDASAIWLVDDLSAPREGLSLQLAASNGIAEEKLLAVIEESQSAREWLNQAVVASTITIRQPEDPFGPLGLSLGFPPDYSSIAAPLRAGDQYLGVLTLAHRTSGRYGEEASAMTGTFANYAAVAIQNARLYNAAQEQAWISTVLLQVAEACQSVTSENELFATMARLTPLLVGVRKCAFYRFDPFEQEFELKAWYGFDPGTATRSVTAAEAPGLSRLAADPHALYLDDAASELGLPGLSGANGNGTSVMLPLVIRGELLGAVFVVHEVDEPTAEKSFDDQNLAILQGIAHQTAITLENIRLWEARQEEAYVTAVLLQAAQAVVSQSSLEDVLDTIVHLMQILVGIDTSLIYFLDHATNRYVLAETTHTASIGHDQLARSFAPGEFPLLDQASQRDELVIYPLPDASLSAEHWPQLRTYYTRDTLEDHSKLRDDWLVGFPLSVKGEVFGVLIAKECGTPPATRSRRLEIIGGIAQQVALAIQNERLNQEMVEREKLEKEIELARQIQTTFLPDHLPEIPGWELDIRWQTARQVGGDFYDVFSLDDDRLGLVIADVADKGLPAALYMTVTRTLIRASSSGESSPGKVLERVNQLLEMDSSNGMFVTAVYAILNLKTGELVYANAGHNRPLIIRDETRQIEQLPRGGMAMGVLPDTRIPDHHYRLNHGDVLLLFTDGVTETFSPAEEPYGVDRLIDTVEEARTCEVDQMLTEIEKALAAFREDHPPSDDITLLAIRRKRSE